MPTIDSSDFLLVDSSRNIPNVGASRSAQFSANDVAGKTGAEQAAIHRSDLAPVQRARQVRKMAFEALADQRDLIRICEDCFQRGLDVAVRNSAPAQFSRNAKPSLAPCLRVLARVIERELRVVEVIPFPQMRDHGRNCFLVLRPSRQIFLHFVDRVRAPHQSPQRRSIKLLFGGQYAGRRTHARI
jgi:hypothetical protein